MISTLWFVQVEIEQAEMDEVSNKAGDLKIIARDKLQQERSQ